MEELDFAKGGGLVPVIVQDAQSGQVLMLAYMNEQAFRETLRTGVATYFSRTYKRLKVKGEKSKHFQRVREILVDCDKDTILLKVEQEVGACHLGYRSCFFRRVEGDTLTLIAERVFDPNQVYD